MSEKGKVRKAFKDNAEIGSGSLAVLLAGAANHFGVPLTPEMVAAGAGLMVGVGQRFKEFTKEIKE